MRLFSILGDRISQATPPQHSHWLKSATEVPKFYFWCSAIGSHHCPQVERNRKFRLNRLASRAFTDQLARSQAPEKGAFPHVYIKIRWADCSALWHRASCKIPQVASPPIRKTMEQDSSCLAHWAIFKYHPSEFKKLHKNRKSSSVWTVCY